MENSRSVRTLRPETENLFTLNKYTFTKKVDYDSRLKTSATGSIKNLLLATPIYKQLFDRKHSQRVYHDNQIFSNDNKKASRREKSPVNLLKIRTDRSFAGLNSHKNLSSINLEASPSLK